MNFSDEETIKVICHYCGAINDIPIEFQYKDDEIIGFMSNGLTKCWYCNKMFGWKMSKETIERILINEF